ncbi:MAG TPA: 23S rRNA (pseudouridine(1915)-N(3))-methyltransferase RlmH [Casimicrobiaceae bacterium]|nr:23S rRNA (pseudouridine(1915)-N(3))-methyltransferase RlmH [Casimicrobiaceae bacterium]
MKIRIVALGHRMPAWVAAGFDDYARRLPRELAFKLVELKPEPRDRGRGVEQILAAEAKHIAAASKGCYIVALDERGERWTTARLAQALRDWRERGLEVAFVIGSADGLSTDFKRNANVIVSLSALTLPHGLVRVLLAEQLYRATSLLRGHPYHRE